MRKMQSLALKNLFVAFRKEDNTLKIVNNRQILHYTEFKPPLTLYDLEIHSKTEEQASSLSDYLVIEFISSS